MKWRGLQTGSTCSKIITEAKSYYWMKLNYWSVSFFVYNSDFSRDLHLLVYLTSLMMNICIKVLSKVRHYLFALGTGNKNDSSEKNAVTTTGEVSLPLSPTQMCEASLASLASLATRPCSIFAPHPPRRV